jgi:hypothetical protein
LLRVGGDFRGLRISWLIVGICRPHHHLFTPNLASSHPGTPTSTARTQHIPEASSITLDASRAFIVRPLDRSYFLSGIRALRLGNDRRSWAIEAYSQPPEKFAHTKYGPWGRQAKHNQFF